MNHRLNGRVKTVVSFEGHKRVNVCDPALGHGSLDITWRHKWYRKNEPSFIKIRDLCASKNAIKKVRRTDSSVGDNVSNSCIQ